MCQMDWPWVLACLLVACLLATVEAGGKPTMQDLMGAKCSNPKKSYKCGKYAVCYGPESYCDSQGRVQSCFPLEVTGNTSAIELWCQMKDNTSQLIHPSCRCACSSKPCVSELTTKHFMETKCNDPNKPHTCGLLAVCYGPESFCYSHSNVMSCYPPEVVGNPSAIHLWCQENKSTLHLINPACGFACDLTYVFSEELTMQHFEETECNDPNKPHKCEPLAVCYGPGSFCDSHGNVMSCYPLDIIGNPSAIHFWCQENKTTLDLIHPSCGRACNLNDSLVSKQGEESTTKHFMETKCNDPNKPHKCDLYGCYGPESFCDSHGNVMSCFPPDVVGNPSAIHLWCQENKTTLHLINPACGFACNQTSDTRDFSQEYYKPFIIVLLLLLIALVVIVLLCCVWKWKSIRQIIMRITNWQGHTSKPVTAKVQEEELDTSTHKLALPSDSSQSPLIPNQDTNMKKDDDDDHGDAQPGDTGINEPGTFSLSSAATRNDSGDVSDPFSVTPRGS